MLVKRLPVDVGSLPLYGRARLRVLDNEIVVAVDGDYSGLSYHTSRYGLTTLVCQEYYSLFGQDSPTSLGTALPPAEETTRRCGAGAVAVVDGVDCFSIAS